MELLNWFLYPVQNHYADFEGRATRKEFWMYILVYLGIFIPLYLVTWVIGLGLVIQLAALAILAPSLAIGARRLHDTGLSGWLQLIGLIPLVGWIVMIVLFARAGEAGANEYGASPAPSNEGPNQVSSTNAEQPGVESAEPPVPPTSTD